MSDVVKLIGTLQSPTTWLSDKNITVLLDTRDREIHCLPVYSKLGDSVVRVNAFINESEV